MSKGTIVLPMDSVDGVAWENADVPGDGQNKQEPPVDRTKRQVSGATMGRLVGLVAKENEED